MNLVSGGLKGDIVVQSVSEGQMGCHACSEVKYTSLSIGECAY